MSSTWAIGYSKRFPKLEREEHADICIVGAGLAGAWSAYLLSKAGKRVILIDKGRIGEEVTLYTTAFITQSIDTSLAELVSIFGEEKAKLVWQSGVEAIDLIESTIKEEKIECEFERSPVYQYASTPKEYASLEEEHRYAEKFGFETRLHPSFDPGFATAGALEILGQAKYHPMKFFYGLLEAAERLGARIFEESEATAIEGSGPVEVCTKGGASIKAESAVVATYQPFNNPWSVFLKKGMYESYVIEISVPSGSVKEGMYLDLENPYHYIRVDRSKSGRDRILIGGEDHRAELTRALADKSARALQEFAARTFSSLDYAVERQWHSQILEPSDGLPLIGLAKPGEYVVTAFSGNGMTYAAISGEIIRDLVLGTSDPYQKLYDPRRTLSTRSLLKKAEDYSEEFFGGAIKNLFT